LVTDAMRKTYDEFIQLTREIYYLQSAEGVLSWDQQTMMPPQGAALRASQLAALTGIVHDRVTDARLVDLLSELETAGAELDEDARVNVREMRRLCDRARKIPRELGQEISRTQVLSQQNWIAARAKSDFPVFAPWLEKMVDLKRQEAEALGYEKSPYDPLLDQYEPHATSAEIDALFKNLRPRLVEIVKAIADSGIQPKREIVRRSFPVEQQKQFGLWAIRKMGFDFSRGRVDTAAHPMTIGNLTDVRLTMRFDENYIPGTLFGLIHEAGHGMYEQGFDPAHAGTPRATQTSLGIHESQSRMWENLIGRSLSFWKHAFPYLQAFFPEQTEDISMEDWYAAINDVRPSLIRVEADEVTYNLHIILRFEIEKSLLEGAIPVRDLPALWNEKMKEYLGIVPENDAQGVLQDIHWSLGLIGYFPTYTLGNLYAAQLFNAARETIPNLPQRIEAGDFLALKEWLNEKIHRPGQTYRAPKLVEVVTGKPPDPEYLLTHLGEKFSQLYGSLALQA
jgi:carboxypeptidase Taq